jgi:hypothetical protein
MLIYTLFLLQFFSISFTHSMGSSFRGTPPEDVIPGVILSKSPSTAKFAPIIIHQSSFYPAASTDESSSEENAVSAVSQSSSANTALTSPKASSSKEFKRSLTRGTSWPKGIVEAKPTKAVPSASSAPHLRGNEPSSQ